MGNFSDKIVEKIKKRIFSITYFRKSCRACSLDSYGYKNTLRIRNT